MASNLLCDALQPIYLRWPPTSSNQLALASIVASTVCSPLSLHQSRIPSLDFAQTQLEDTQGGSPGALAAAEADQAIQPIQVHLQGLLSSRNQVPSPITSTWNKE